MTGPAQLEADLRVQGHTTESTVAGGLPFVLLRDFTVLSGRHMGRVVDLGFQVMPDYPLQLAPALHVRANPSLIQGSENPGGYTVIQSHLGPEWQYWSFNFTNDWQQGRGASLTAIINRVMDRA